MIATVGDVDITEADLAVFFESEVLPIDETLRQTIFGLAAGEILQQRLRAEFDVEVDQEEVDANYANLLSQMETAGVTTAEFLGVEDADVGMLLFNAEIGVLRQQVVDGLIRQPEVIDAFFSDPKAYTKVCVRHVLVETADEAEVVLTRLGDGEDFAGVATEVSLDTGTPGGALSCAIAANYVTEFADATLAAEIGALFGPVETQFGFHVLVVDERSAPTEEEVIADPRAFLTDTELDGLWGDWLNEALRDASVTIDEKYGFWTPVGILRPDQEHLLPTEE